MLGRIQGSEYKVLFELMKLGYSFKLSEEIKLRLSEESGINYNSFRNSISILKKQNYLCCKSSKYYWFSDEFIDLLKKLQDKKFYFMADFSREAHNRVDNLSLSFLNKLKSNGIDINRLVLVKNDSSKIGLYKMKYENFTLNTFFSLTFSYQHTTTLTNILIL